MSLITHSASPTSGHRAKCTSAGWDDAARSRATHQVRDHADQALTSTLPMGRVDRPHIRSIPAAVPAVRRADANSIAFITHSADIRQMLGHTGVQSEPPNIAPARGPPLWDECDAQVGEGAQVKSDWDMAGQPALDYEVDQRVNW